MIFFYILPFLLFNFYLFLYFYYFSLYFLFNMFFYKRIFVYFIYFYTPRARRGVRGGEKLLYFMNEKMKE
jgi:hypothetical protein